MLHYVLFWRCTVSSSAKVVITKISKTSIRINILNTLRAKWNSLDFFAAKRCSAPRLFAPPDSWKGPLWRARGNCFARWFVTLFKDRRVMLLPHFVTRIQTGKMWMKFAFAVLVLVLVDSSLAADEGRKAKRKDWKSVFSTYVQLNYSLFAVLPIFQVVKFPNDVCSGGSRNGTCFTAWVHVTDSGWTFWFDHWCEL